MAKDIGQELDAILSPHKARVAQARDEAAGRSAEEEAFASAAAGCLAQLITPALQQLAAALNDRGVAARVLPDGMGTRIDIPVSRHARLGHGHGGYPYLRARPDRHTRSIRFEQNSADAHGGSAIGDFAIAQIDAELVRAMVLDLVRKIYAPA